MGIYIPFSWWWLWCGALSVEGAVCWRALSGGRVISTGLGVLSRQAAAYQIASNSAHSFSATSLVLGSRLLQHPVAAAFPGNSLGWFYSRASLVAQLVKNSPAMGDLGSIPGLERSPGEGKGYPLQYSGLENSMDYIVHGVAKGRTRLSDVKYLPVDSFAWHPRGCISRKFFHISAILWAMASLCNKIQISTLGDFFLKHFPSGGDCSLYPLFPRYCLEHFTSSFPTNPSLLQPFYS